MNQISLLRISNAHLIGLSVVEISYVVCVTFHTKIVSEIHGVRIFPLKKKTDLSDFITFLSKLLKSILTH